MSPGDPDRPASARVYDFLRGGHDWYQPDRDLAVKLEGIYPGLRRMAANNQAYLGHAVLWASGRHGIRQYLDLGSGFPSASSVRDIAQAADPTAVIACVDWDPIVADPRYGYGPVLDRLGVKGVTMTLADIRDVDAVLAAPGVTGIIDLDRPALAVLGLVLYTMPAAEARRVVAAYAGVLAPGSAMVVTVARNDDPEVSARLTRAWQDGTGARFENFTRVEVETLFDGLDIQPPGVGPVAGLRPGWKSARSETPGTSYVVGAIGIKGLPQRKDWDGPRIV